MQWLQCKQQLPAPLTHQPYTTGATYKEIHPNDVQWLQCKQQLPAPLTHLPHAAGATLKKAATVGKSRPQIEATSSKRART